eukprot:5214648-Pleurochrysis_carterae.AAC.1
MLRPPVLHVSMSVEGARFRELGLNTSCLTVRSELRITSILMKSLSHLDLLPISHYPRKLEHFGHVRDPSPVVEVVEEEAAAVEMLCLQQSEQTKTVGFGRAATRAKGQGGDGR